MKSLANIVGIRPLPDNDRIGLIEISDPFDPGKRINNWGVVEVVPNRLVFHDIRKDVTNKHLMSDQELIELSNRVVNSLAVDTDLEISVGDLVMYPYQYNLEAESVEGIIPISYCELYACKRGDTIHPLNGNIFVTKIEQSVLDTRCYEGEVVYAGKSPRGYLLYDYIPREVFVGQRLFFEGFFTPEHKSHTVMKDHLGVVSYRNVIATHDTG